MSKEFLNGRNALIVNLCGELDHHSSEEVRVKIDDRIDRDNIRKVILDFNGISFMDSSGIGVVVGGAIADVHSYRAAYILGVVLIAVALIQFRKVTAPYFLKNRLR